MRLIIAGGRDYQFMADDMRRLDELHQQREITEVVSGGATGADHCGEVWAKLRGVPVRVFHADWKAYGKEAKHEHDRQMAEYADAAILFPGGRGTLDMFRQAKRAGIEIYDHRDVVSGGVRTLEDVSNAWQAGGVWARLSYHLGWWVAVWLGCTSIALPLGGPGAMATMMIGTLWIVLAVAVGVLASHGFARLASRPIEVPGSVQRRQRRISMVAVLIVFGLLRICRAVVIESARKQGFPADFRYHLWPPGYALGGAAFMAIAYGLMALVVIGAVRLTVRSKEHHP